MYLKTITLTGFKNYSGIDFRFTPGINFLYGPNGSGKTNLLDAIHYLSTCKSFLVNTDIQNIQAGQSFFFIEGELESEFDKSDRLQCAVKKGEGKVFRKNKKEYEKLSDHFGFFPSVVISPSDHDLLHGGSAEKRKFMDSLISVYDKKYLDDLIRYGKVLEQRNAALKSIRETGIVHADLLDIYDEQMEELSVYIHARRVDMAEKMIPCFMEMYAALSGTDEFPEMRLKADLAGGISYRQLLKENRNRDLALTFTSAGPHKDDLEFYLGGRPAKNAASQGQQKTFLTALKLARFIFIREITGKSPVLLLDDVFDKLDRSRVTNLISIISKPPFRQVFITDTEKERIGSVIGELKSEVGLFEITANKTPYEETV